MPRTRAPALLLVTPYLADANNGNWRTAARWSRLLAPHFRVIVQAASAPMTGGNVDDAVAMIALHARRSHEAIAAWRARHPDRPLIVTLTGTDLYRDIPQGDRGAHASLAMADLLVVLQDDAPSHLPATARSKARVILQSARALTPWPGKRGDRLHCVLAAHMRAEKDPATAFEAWRRVPADAPATLTLVGAALDPALGRAARDLAAADSRVKWHGPRAHSWTRQAIKRAHVLLVPSQMEGGANVVVEAVTAGTAVIASRVSGNVGMLGVDYPGYFAPGDAVELAELLMHSLHDRAFLHTLEARCRALSSRFAPAAEARALLRVVTEARRLVQTRIPA